MGLQAGISEAEVEQKKNASREETKQSSTKWFFSLDSLSDLSLSLLLPLPLSLFLPLLSAIFIQSQN